MSSTLKQAFATVILICFATSASSQDRGLASKVGTIEDASAWEITAETLREVIERFEYIDGEAIVTASIEYEYAIPRNGGFRKLTFSTWNWTPDNETRHVMGWRIATEPYLMGDTKDAFRMGRSVWVFNTRDKGDAACRDQPKKLRHYYLFEMLGDSPAFVNSGKCSTDGPVWRRKRLFVDDME